MQNIKNNLQDNNNFLGHCAQTTNNTTDLFKDIECENIFKEQTVDNQVVVASLSTRDIYSYKNKTELLSRILVEGCEDANENQIVSKLHNLAAQYSYQEYKSWIFTQSIYLPLKCCSKNYTLASGINNIYFCPIEYASEYEKPCILNAIANIMETKI